ncbi:MAG TPA: hypothetical protein VN317_05135 [Candidatus Methanoperedens sp.]|nr:hypothetical protein [Candidatus Methanoperedens sp.]
MLGAGTTGCATPLAFGYALHAARRGSHRVLGRVALGLASLEGLAGVALAAAWLWNSSV